MIARQRRDGLRKCSVCRRAMVEDAFRWMVKRGKRYRDSFCVECHREYSRQWQAHWYTTPAGRAAAKHSHVAREKRLRAANEVDREWRRAAEQRAIATLLAAGWTKTAIAAAVGVKLPVLWTWTTGQKVAKPANVAKLRRLAMGADAAA